MTFPHQSALPGAAGLLPNWRCFVRKRAGLALSVCFFVGVAASGCGPDEARAIIDKAIPQDGLAGPQGELEKRITSAPARVMEKSGLAGAMGGAHVRVISGDPQDILLPIPQLADGQVPVCYFIRVSPSDAATDFRLRRSEEGNVAVRVRLAGKKQDVQIAWSSVVLLAPRTITPNRTPVDPYRKATACVQSGADRISKLATEIWPPSGKASEFAANIQRHIRAMKGTAPPRSLDALGILKSGANGICTGNTNLAAALMRSKGIACRSVAVIPPISQRLEMHRIAEFAEDGRWIPFDPSSLHPDIPAKPWQNIIMAKTTIQDEQTAMKPRMSVMMGCPYGQEIELLSPGAMLFGEDMFWTMAKPLAEFVPTNEAIRLATEAWTRYLETGTLTQGQRKTRVAKTATELVELLKTK
jgi:hypothetical protein